MRLAAQNKKIKGVYWSGSRVGGNSSTPTILHKLQRGCPIKPTTSRGDAYTSGYAVAFTVSSSVQFKIYTQENPNTPLDYLPDYSVSLFYAGEVTPIDGVSLVYDGDGLFHISGTISNKVYDDAKVMVGFAGFGIFFLDSNGNCFLTDTSTELISTSSASSTTAANFYASSMSFLQNTNYSNEQYEEVVVSPLDIMSFNGFSGKNAYYAVGSASSGRSGSRTVTHTLL